MKLSCADVQVAAAAQATAVESYCDRDQFNTADDDGGAEPALRRYGRQHELLLCEVL